MAAPGSLEALRALQGELVAVRDHRLENLQILEQSLAAHEEAFKNLLDKPPRSQKSRTAVTSGKIKIDDEEYKINADFAENTLKLADEVELDEIEAAQILLAASEEPEVPGRSLLENGIVRFHLQRGYLLECMRLCIQLAGDDELETLRPGLQDGLGTIVTQMIFGVVPPGPGRPAPERSKKFVPRCMAAMQDIRSWLQRISDKMAALSMMSRGNQAQPHEFQEAIEFSRKNLVTQHQTLALLMFSAVEKRHAETQDFKDFLGVLKKTNQYDNLLVHMFPALGAYISVFGSTEGRGDYTEARVFNDIICQQNEEASWSLLFLRAAVRAWWIAEYSGWYLDGVLEGVDMDKEDEERTKLFLESLKDGAFDFLLSIAADCKTRDWHDPMRTGMRQWLQRKSPPLSTEQLPFDDIFQLALMAQLEVFIDASISNLPDVLRKLRTEEDEQRQLSQAHEQDLDLERFLIIIAHAYEGRPDAAMSFWEDPDSNLAGFLQWASKRASTPLVSAFCEMLQALSDNEECANAAHDFLLDEGHHSSGKMRRSQSLTWSQIFKELGYFTNKMRERPSPSAPTSYRVGKPNADQAETEPESEMMLECYLRLMTKLSLHSRATRDKLISGERTLLDTLFQLASGLIPPRLRAWVLHLLRALLTGKSVYGGNSMWQHVDNWMNGHYVVQTNPHRAGFAPLIQDPVPQMKNIFDQLAKGFEQPNAFIQLFTTLVTPARDFQQLNDGLPFPEDLGANVRMPGIEPYVDFVLGQVFAVESRELADVTQLRILRLSCLDFALTCLQTFNEDLIILGNESNIAVDAAMEATDLATYVRLHPFARVMEHMFNDKVLEALFSTIHQDPVEVSNADHDSALILSIERAVEVMLKVFELQTTYLDLVRPAIKLQSGQRSKPVSDAAFSSFEDGIMSHLSLVVDLGRYCGIGYPPLTLACLKLLEKISTSSKIISAWNPISGRQGHRNKAIVALESNAEAEAIASSLSAELTATLDFSLEAATPNYQIKVFILDFLYECLRVSPERPSIAHLLLGFRCELDALTVEPGGAFDVQASLFHSLLNIFLELPYSDEAKGMRGWLIALKYKAIRIFQVLWNSSLSSALVMNELRVVKFPFHILIRGVSIESQLRWDELETSNPEFLLTEASHTYINFLSIRAMVFEYIGKELCSVSQSRMPAVKRQIFDALNGQIEADDNSTMSIPNIFDLFDFLLPVDEQPSLNMQFVYYKDLDLSACAEEDLEAGVQYDLHKVEEVLLLKRKELRLASKVIQQDELMVLDMEEATILGYITISNQQGRLIACRRRVLHAWANLLLVMFEANEFKGATKVSFLLQALQAILPSLEGFSVDNPPEALELAKVSMVLLFKLDFSIDPTSSSEKSTMTRGNLISDKLFQLFQVCLNAIGKWAGSAELRTVYYTICYRYLTGITDQGDGTAALERDRATKLIRNHGERLLNVVCDDAYGGDSGCQTAAMVLLGAMVQAGRADDVIETLNRLNFIGILVDSLKTVLDDWLAAVGPTVASRIASSYNNAVVPRRGGGAEGPLSASSAGSAAEQYLAAKLALLLQLCQTRGGAKLVVQANLFRALELSRVFTADPELEMAPGDVRALERHYALLAALARIVAAAVLSRGAHNVVQGRRFLQQHRLLIVHALKRSAGIGGTGQGGVSKAGMGMGVGASGSVMMARGQQVQAALEDRVQELAEAFMVLITATGFLEFEEDQAPSDRPRGTPVLFH